MNLNDVLFKLYFSLNKPKENAGFFLRFFAFVIDFIILSTVNYFLMVTLKMGITIQSDTFNPILLLSHPLPIIINWLYYAILESTANYQATIGKSILRLKVVDVYGKKISFGRASGRFFGKIVSSLIFGIGFIMIAFTKNRQGLHDMAAGTFVKIKY